ncbi:DUF1638 domain-containing protein [Poseidonocella sedimentorum]|nr:DUF1638 domain-containing protein [Poseidonocella sedimentorum]
MDEVVSKFPGTANATPVEEDLRNSGLSGSGQGSVLLIACGALAHEILALRDANCWTHLDLRCLPALLHNHPEKIAGAVREAVLAARADYAQIFVVYADCGTGGALDRVCADLGVARIAGPHCYAFFDGVDRFIARDEIDAFYLTDFLTRQFDAFVIRPLGLDRHPELRDAYFGHYRTLVYLAQTDDPSLDIKAREAAERLGLSFERRATGYGELASQLGDWAAASAANAD